MMIPIMNYIILIGSVLLALERIFSLLIKPRKWFKKREEERQKTKRENEILQIKELVKAALDESDVQRSEKLKEDFKKITDSLVDDFFEMSNCDLEEKMEGIKQVLASIQQENLCQTNDLAILTRGTRDLLGREIWKIYYKYKRAKKLPQTVKVDLDHMYDDYILAKGNSTIPPIYEEMRKWEVLGYEE